MAQPKYPNYNIRCWNCGNNYVGPFRGSTCPHCGHKPDDIGALERLICFLLPPLGILFILTSLNDCEKKQYSEAATWGFLFYVLLIFISAIISYLFFR